MLPILRYEAGRKCDSGSIRKVMVYFTPQGERSREPLRKLKEAVAKAMPEQIIKYHAELKVHNEAKYAK